MAEQWIDAATAVSLVTGGPHNLGARRSLCIRAHSGLLQTRARLLVLTERKLVSRQENVAVPQEFWWAEGDEALEQNWVAGDFSTWIDGRVRVQAFGVTFALSGMLELLPAEKRALAARRLSVAGDPAWVKASEARRFAYEKAVSIAGSGTAILDQARLGFVTARAVLAQRFDRTRGSAGSVTEAAVWEEREWDIPVSFWREFTDKGLSHQDWDRGLFDGAGPGPNGPCFMRLQGVHFLAESLQVLLPAQDSGATGEAGPKQQGKGGGQPPRTFWDDMIVAVAGLILHGQLVPTRQAEVTDAMLTWAAVNGHDISESAVKPKAKKLFEAYEKEGRNFLDGGS